MTDAPAAQATPWIRVLTLNAHQGFHAQRRRPALIRMRDALRASLADLVFLQEIGAVSAAEPAAEQFEVLADGMWPQYAYGRNAVATGGHHGNALLSKYPIDSWRNVDASVGEAEPRGFLHCAIGLPGGGEFLHAVCLHLALREDRRVLLSSWPAISTIGVATRTDCWCARPGWSRCTRRRTAGRPGPSRRAFRACGSTGFTCVIFGIVPLP
jgi:endonuclease/exonuclease/phosphatase family metal-dependent hydrolase